MSGRLIEKSSGFDEMPDAPNDSEELVDKTKKETYADQIRNGPGFRNALLNAGHTAKFSDK